MRMVDIIEKKRDGGKLTKEEIEFFVNGYVRGDIPDYQASALLMAIYFRNMDYDETLNLTLAMENSGDKLDLSGINGIKVDKHSTGGVGDKTSLVLAPMVAALGGKVAKMSGRGLGNTGGTIDKLESIPGFRTSLSKEEFIKNINETGLALTGQTVCPAARHCPMRPSMIFTAPATAAVQAVVWWSRTLRCTVPNVGRGCLKRREQRGRLDEHFPKAGAVHRRRNGADAAQSGGMLYHTHYDPAGGGLACAAGWMLSTGDPLRP